MLSWFNFYVKNLNPYYIYPGVRREVWIPLHFSTDGYLVVPTSYLTILVGSAVLFTHYIFIYAWVYLWTFNSVPFICLSIFHRYHAIPMINYTMSISTWAHPSSPFFFRKGPDGFDCLFLHLILRISLSKQSC